MTNKEVFKSLISQIKASYQKRGVKITTEEIGKKMGMEKSTIFNLTGKHGKVTRKHIAQLKEEFANELSAPDNVTLVEKPIEEMYIFLKDIKAELAVISTTVAQIAAAVLPNQQHKKEE